VSDTVAPGSLLSNDLYQLTMARAYRLAGRHEREAVFHLGIRRPPFGGGFIVAAGLGSLLADLERLRFSSSDLDYLGGLRDAVDRPVFEAEFLDYLRAWRFRGAIEAVPEGTLVFPGEPLLRVRAGLLDAQLLETPLLNCLGFQSLVATKAARVRLAAGPEAEILEFGLRRAQGPDGGVSASRAAFLGGCDGTSNLAAGSRWQIPVRGTHAHSFVLAAGDEERAFAEWIRAAPASLVFLVDTFESETGIERVIAACRAAGVRPQGVRLDSGDLAALSRAARRRLDEAGYTDCRVIASGDLDEDRIAELRRRGAAIDTWGVGTRLVTGHPDAAASAVYKLGALRGEDGRWLRLGKRSDDAEKASLLGSPQVVRWSLGSRWLGDAVFDDSEGADPPALASLVWHGRQPRGLGGEDVRSETLLRPMVVAGALVEPPEPLAVARDRCRAQLRTMPPGLARLDDPPRYPVGVEGRMEGF